MNWWRVFVFLPMHCGLRDNVADFRKCTRSIWLDPVSSFMYWRMNWHLEHPHVRRRAVLQPAQAAQGDRVRPAGGQERDRGVPGDARHLEAPNGSRSSPATSTTRRCRQPPTRATSTPPARSRTTTSAPRSATWPRQYSFAGNRRSPANSPGTAPSAAPRPRYWRALPAARSFPRGLGEFTAPANEFLVPYETGPSKTIRAVHEQAGGDVLGASSSSFGSKPNSNWPSILGSSHLM